jgi:ribosomal protein S19
MGRSFKKGPYVDEKLFIKVSKRVESGSREPIRHGREGAQ